MTTTAQALADYAENGLIELVTSDGRTHHGNITKIDRGWITFRQYTGGPLLINADHVTSARRRSSSPVPLISEQWPEPQVWVRVEGDLTDASDTVEQLRRVAARIADLGGAW